MPTASIANFAFFKSPKISKFFYSTFFFIAIFSFAVNGLVANGGSIKDVKGLLKFQKAADELQELYSEALEKYEVALMNNFEKIRSNEAGLIFSNNKCAVSYYYGTEKDNIEQLERLYASYGSDNELQQSMVADIKSCQREMKKLNMFTKAYADYVNSQRYLQDDGKGNGRLMIGKVSEIIDGLKFDLQTLNMALDRMKYETEEVYLSDHPLKIMLSPMIQDMAFLSQVIIDSQNSENDSQTLEKISSKRTDLASTKEKRSREVDYLLKGSEKLKLYKNFYLKYNAILTQTEMRINNNASDKGAIKDGLNEGNKSLNQLNSSYERLKGIFTASN